MCMCKVISVVNNKGGVGKTTSTSVFAEIFASVGLRVLVVDLDEQSNLSMFFQAYEEDSDAVINGIEVPARHNVAELFRFRYRESEEVRNLIRTTNVENVDIIPSSKRFKRTANEILQNTGNNNIVLKKALQGIKPDYDFILIDNAPANNILTVNSMFASDYVLVPVKTEGYSYKGLKETMASILYIKEEHDLDDLQFLGVFATQVNPIANAYKEYRAMCELELQDKFFHAAIRQDTKISEVEQRFHPVLQYCPKSNAVKDYVQLLLEMKVMNDADQQILEKAFINMGGKL